MVRMEVVVTRNKMEKLLEVVQSHQRWLTSLVYLLYVVDMFSINFCISIILNMSKWIAAFGVKTLTF